VGFPACQCGWNSQPEAARCPDCDTIVQRVVRDLIIAAVSDIVRRCRTAQQAGGLSGVGQAGRPRLRLSAGVELAALFDRCAG
jgi:hypothetical protein